MVRSLEQFNGDAKNRSTWLIQDEQVGVKCMWNRGWASSHLLMLGCLCVP